jgi:hypothetical protein
MSIYFLTEFFKYFFRVLHEASLAGHLPTTLYRIFIQSIVIIITTMHITHLDDNFRKLIKSY